MTDLRKAAEMALEALEAHKIGNDHTEPISKTIQALRQALAQPEQEPYGIFQYDLRIDAWVQNRNTLRGIAFYTVPQKREWIGLTAEQIFEHEWWDEETAYAVNKFLMEKNT